MITLRRQLLKLALFKFNNRYFGSKSLTFIAILSGLICCSVTGASAATVNWTGTTSTDWNTKTNWDTGKVPGAGDDVYIATSTSYTSFFQPYISGSETATIKSLTLGVVQTSRSGQSYNVFGTTFYNFLFTIDGTLKVNGNITMRTNFSGTGVNYVPQIAGAGNITANNFIIGDASYQSYMTNDAQHYAGLYLNLTGTINLGTGTIQLNGVSNADVAPATGPCAVYVQSATIICGGITSNTNNAPTYFFLDVTSFSGFIGSNVTSTGKLIVSSATPFPSPSNNGRQCYFNFGSTSASSQTIVEFVGTGATQTIPNNLVDYNPYKPNELASYDNVTVSPAGTGTHTLSTPSANTLTILDNLTTSGTSVTVNFATYNSPLYVGGNFTNGSGVTVKQGTGSTTVMGAVANAGTLTLGSGSVSFGGAFSNTGPVTASGAVKVGGAVSNSSTMTLGTGSVSFGGSFVNSGPFTSTGITTVAGAVTSSNTMTFGAGAVSLSSTTVSSSTITAGSGSITFGSDFINSSGGALKASSGNIYFDGNYTNSAGASFTASTGTVYFNGAASQTLTDNSTAGSTFNNISFTSGPTATTKTMTGNSKFAVSSTGVLSIVGGNTTVVTGGLLSLQANANGAASVNTISSGSSITGNVNAQCYFKPQSTAGYKADYTRNYRLMSSPVNANSIVNNSSINAYYTLTYLSGSSGIFTGGPGGTANGFTVTNATPTIYLYKESLAVSNSAFNSGNFKGITNIKTSPLTVYNDAGTTANVSATMYAGNGFMLYYAGNNTANTTSAKPNSGGYNKSTRVGGYYASVDASTSTTTGTLNQGSIPVKIWWSSSTNLTDLKTSFNLVGNPYASTIDWDKFSTTTSSAGIYGPNLSSTIYVFNYATKNYGTYQAGTTGGTGTNNASHLIASGQAFFVKVKTSAGSTLTFNEVAKTTTQPTGNAKLLAVQPAAMASGNLMRLKLSVDSVNTDDIMLIFQQGATNGYDADVDAPRLTGMGNIASLASYAQNNTSQLAINHMAPIDSTTRIKLYMAISGSSGIDTLAATGISSLDPRYNVYLIDHYKNDSLLLSKYPKYLFNVYPADTLSYGANRFGLVFHKNAAYNYMHLLAFNGSLLPAGSIGAQLSWKTDHEGDFTGFMLQRQDASGQFETINQVQSNGQGSYSYQDKTAPVGVNYYRLQMNDAYGQITYSTVVTVRIGTASNTAANSSEGLQLAVYPNPVASSIRVRVVSTGADSNTAGTTTSGGSLQVRIISTDGQVLSVLQGQGGVATGDISSLKPGTYIAVVTDAQGQHNYGRKLFVKL